MSATPWGERRRHDHSASECDPPGTGKPLGKVSDFQSLKYIYIYSARETLFSPIDR